MTANIHPYTYAGISESGKIDYLDDYRAVLKKKIRFVELQRFIKDNYPQTLYVCRKAEIIKYKMALIYTLEKYLDMIVLPGNMRATKVYLAHNIFNNNHATFFYSVNRFKEIMDFNSRFGHFADEVILQKEIEKTMIDYFNIQQTIK